MTVAIGIIWGHVIMILTLAYFGKFTGGSLAARATGFGWREAGTIGALMSCKGYAIRSETLSNLLIAYHL